MRFLAAILTAAAAIPPPAIGAGTNLPKPGTAIIDLVQATALADAYRARPVQAWSSASPRQAAVQFAAWVLR
jgi:hypothetical protein